MTMPRMLVQRIFRPFGTARSRLSALMAAIPLIVVFSTHTGGALRWWVLSKHALWALFLGYLIGTTPATAFVFEERTLRSVVSVIPLWPGHLRGGEPGTPPGSAPEGTAIAVLPGGLLATALHVVDRATEITVRLSDGRRFKAQLVAGDAASDIALLRVPEEIPILELAAQPILGAEVCAVGNQFGLGLSVTCGVVSATGRTGTGFNPVEDFIQTDATVNPGSSGGALLDDQGRLVGMLSAIFSKGSDADIGVNFAVSSALLMRVVRDLASLGRFIRPMAGLRVRNLTGEETMEAVGVRVTAVTAGQPADLAGILKDDLIVSVGERPIRKASDLITALALMSAGEKVAVALRREEQDLTVQLTLSR
jgi:S1-C subfamily serine protease